MSGRDSSLLVWPEGQLYLLTHALGWGWGRASPLFQCHHMANEDWVQLSYAENFRASSPTPLPTGLAVLYFLSKVQDLLFQILQLLGERSRLSNYHGLSQSASPPALSIERGEFFPCPCCHMTNVYTSFLYSFICQWTLLCFCISAIINKAAENVGTQACLCNSNFNSFFIER